ncbi:MAG: hypothetical protein IJU29_01785 [Oscillospiraceae bacterium]|nr:hypothetical protein [Oscillospiraceae bacterium]
MPEQIYRRRFGDRKDGRLLRTLSPFYRVIPYIMPRRSDALNMIADSVEISGLEDWLRAKRADGWKGMGMLHVTIAAYVRMISHCPGVNRFVSGQKIYARNNIELVMIVKRAMSSEAEETSIKVVFDPADTVFDIYRKLGEKVDEIKADQGDNNTERAARVLTAFPGLLLKFAVWVLRVIDYFGGLPRALLDASPFHGSMIITDLGSLGLGPIYHHIYDFGNLPVFIAMGAKRKAYELDKTGQAVERKYVDYKFEMDERVVDGLYFANALKYLKYYLKNPVLLEQPPEQVYEDIF